MEKIKLTATERQVLGKKVRFLRKQGETPVHLYGAETDSLALQSKTALLERVLPQAGVTKLIELKLDGEATPRVVMIREVQRDALSRQLLHVDFFQVQLEEKIKVEVPIILVGESPFTKGKGGMLVQDLNVLGIESLPDRVPSEIKVDVSSLTEPGQKIRVKDLELGSDVRVLIDPEVVVVAVSITQAEAPKGAEAATAGETAAGAAPEGTPEK